MESTERPATMLPPIAGPVASRSASADAPLLLVVVLNPSTGRFRANDLLRLLEHELGSSYALHLIETSPERDTAVAVRAIADAAAVVLACGGDGTVNAVASGLIGHHTPLAILPGGTTNIIAQGLGIPADPLAVCQLLRGDALTVALDVAQVGEHFLLHMGGAGYDAHLMGMTNRAAKRGFGLGAYLVFGARGLLDQPIVDFTILIDGRTIRERGWMALVANGSDVFTRGLRLGPHISTTDGMLDLVLFTAPGFLDAAASFLSILVRRYRSPYLRYERGKQIEIHADPPLPVDFDGDPVGTTPFIAEVLPAALKVLVPPPGNGRLIGPWLRRNLANLLPSPGAATVFPSEY
ncbi:MAG TPA: diacylglycerol kinase family protein [Thermomicrobiales bacterium]